MIWSALVLGFLGSLHCAAMCGPLMLGLAGRDYKVFALAIHHLGRWMGYILLAALFRLLVTPLYLFEIQQYTAIVSGVLLILYAIKDYVPVLRSLFLSITNFISQKMGKLAPGRNGSIAFGILNGLLPCGLSFGAAIISVNMDTMLGAATYMLAFGVGTTPMLFAISYLPKFGKQSFLQKINLHTPKILLIMGCLLVLRGAGLGIPYVSPKFNPKTEKAACCTTVEKQISHKKRY